MSINPLLANRLPYASASAVKQDNPTAFVVKNEERSSWKKPVYYTALAVAGIGVAFFAYNSGILFGYFLGGIFSSSNPPPQPSPTPSSPPSPQPSPTPSSSPQPSPQQKFDTLRKLGQILRQIAEDPQKTEEEKASIAALADNWEQTSDSNLWGLANLNIIDKKDCPDLEKEKVCPVPNQICHKVISNNGNFRTWDCYNTYIRKLVKENCPQFTLFTICPLINVSSYDCKDSSNDF